MSPRVEVCSWCRLLSSCLFHVSFSASFASCYSHLNCPILSFKNIIRETGVVDYYCYIVTYADSHLHTCTYICRIIHSDTMIKTQEDFFTIFTSHFICKVSKGLFPRLVITIFKCTSSHTLLNGCSSGDLFILICRHTYFGFLLCCPFIKLFSDILSHFVILFIYKGQLFLLRITLNIKQKL